MFINILSVTAAKCSLLEILIFFKAAAQSGLGIPLQDMLLDLCIMVLENVICIVFITSCQIFMLMLSCLVLVILDKTQKKKGCYLNCICNDVPNNDVNII